MTMETKVKKKHAVVKLRKLERFEASALLGTPFSVVLHNAVDEKYCEDCGEVLGHVIPDPKSLFAAVAVLRVSDPQKLNGQEIRFLRKSLSQKAKDFAREISVSAEQLSRFENDKQPISEVYEKLLRLTVCIGHIEHTVRLGANCNFRVMQIRGVRDVRKELEIHLNFGPAKPTTTGSSGDSGDFDAYQIAS
jgi:DNA-binding transcriptional regulator YiaG